MSRGTHPIGRSNPFWKEADTYQWNEDKVLLAALWNLRHLVDLFKQSRVLRTLAVVRGLSSGWWNTELGGRRWHLGSLTTNCITGRSREWLPMGCSWWEQHQEEDWLTQKYLDQTAIWTLYPCLQLIKRDRAHSKRLSSVLGKEQVTCKPFPSPHPFSSLPFLYQAVCGYMKLYLLKNPASYSQLFFSSSLPWLIWTTWPHWFSTE